MDALALLCNLYGDGPSTLRRLRGAGCATVAQLERKSPGELADLLHIGAEQAGRLIREAHQISLRLGSLEEEEDGPPAVRASRPVSTPPAPALDDFQEYEGYDRDLPDHELQSSGPADPRELLERVLHVWRERDRSGPIATGVDSDDDELPDEDDQPELARGPGPSGASLRPHVLDGLDLDTCLGLRRAGIETLADLARVDQPLDLSREVGLGLTRILRLQFLARRRLGERAGRDELVPRPPPTPSASGASGARAPASEGPSPGAQEAPAEPAAALPRTPEVRRGPRPISELLTNPLAEAAQALAPPPAELLKFSCSEQPFSLAPVGDPVLCRQLELLDGERPGVLTGWAPEGTPPGPRSASRSPAGSSGRSRDEEAAGSAGPFA
jgi:hypothetical protein